MIPSESNFLARRMVAWYSFSFLNASSLIPVTTLIEAVGNVTFVAAIFSSLISVGVKFLTAIRTSEIIDSLTLHLIEMAVPPSVATLVTAESFFLSFCDLLNLTSAVFTTCCPVGKYYSGFSQYTPVDSITTAE